MDTVIEPPPVDRWVVSAAVLDVWQEARERWAERVELPADLPLGLRPPAGLSLSIAALLHGALRPGMDVWLGPREASEEARAWLAERFRATCRPAPEGVAVAALRASHAEPALWRSVGRATVIVDVPELAERPLAARSEPGDEDLTPRLTVQWPGRVEAKPLAVGGLSRQFWRERAAMQRCAGPGGDLLLVSGLRCCCLPGCVLVSVQA